jgi:NMD protein affecting ribosome stability and mRNA decay
MPTASITQCDLCPAVTDNYWTFFRIKVSANGPTSVDAEATLCPNCAKPALALQQAMLDGRNTDEEKRERTKRLNERILSALKKTE